MDVLELTAKRKNVKPLGIHFASGTRCRPNAEQNQDVLKLHPKLIFLIKIYFVCFFFLEKLQCSIILQLLTRHCYSWLSVLFFRKLCCQNRSRGLLLQFHLHKQKTSADLRLGLSVRLKSEPDRRSYHTASSKRTSVS